MKLRTTTIAATALGTLLLAGCSGPSSLTGGSGTICASSSEYEHLVGSVRLENDGESEITLDSVSFGELDNIEVRDVWAAPDAERADNWARRGVAAPESRDDEYWADAVEVSGASVPPGGSNAVFFSITRTEGDQDGTLTDVIIEYREGTGFTSRAGQFTAELAYGFGEDCGS